MVGREGLTQFAQQFVTTVTAPPLVGCDIWIGYHVYSDDTQLYISFKCEEPLEAILKLNICLANIMITNRLMIRKQNLLSLDLHN